MCCSCTESPVCCVSVLQAEVTFKPVAPPAVLQNPALSGGQSQQQTLSACMHNSGTEPSNQKQAGSARIAPRG
jgi:hypothetical protein